MPDDPPLARQLRLGRDRAFRVRLYVDVPHLRCFAFHTNDFVQAGALSEDSAHDVGEESEGHCAKLHILGNLREYLPM